MQELSTAKLLHLTRIDGVITPPTGFVAVRADQLDVQNARINYQAFFNPASNELVIGGTPKPQMLVQPGQAPEDGKELGIFYDSPRSPTGGLSNATVPVTQTVALVQRLTAAAESPYPNATVSFAGEGAVGLAFSAASYELRSGLSSQVNVGSTVTLNAWTGHWTPDGRADTGVLDVRTPHPANGDPAWGMKWKPGGVVAAVNTGNAQLAGGLADIGTQGAMALGERLAGKLGGQVLGEGTAWIAEKLVGKGAEALTEHAADATASAAATHVDSPTRAVAALGWKASLTPAETSQVLQQNIGQGQWNVMHGLSPSGYAVDGTYYENTGTATVAGAGSTAETRQPAVQVTTWRDETTGAIMEARLSGQRVDGQFQADTTGVFTSGMDTAGRMILKGAAAQSVADHQMRPTASRGTDASTSEDAALAPVTVEAGSGLGTYTTVSIQTHANGAASFDFVGEDGSHAWVMHNAENGRRTVTINSGQDVEGEPRTVIYELDRDSRRIGHERYFDASGTPVNERGEMQAPQAAPMPAPVQAPAQQEPIPQITTHEQRVTRTPGGMSFAEAHRRRDEPEQISPGSLQPVGKLDVSGLDKGSPVYRMHQAQEQDLMRALGIAQAQDRERFRNEPSPQRTLQPWVERTQERTQDRTHKHRLDEEPLQMRQRAPSSAPEAKAPTPLPGETAAAVVHMPSLGHANPVPASAPPPPPPSEPAATVVVPLHPAAAAAAAAAPAGPHAELAAAQARLAEAQEQLARLTGQGRQGNAAPAATARPADPRDASHPEHRDFQKIYTTVAKDGRWDARQSANIAAQALADLKADPLSKRVDVVQITPDTFGKLKVFAGYAPWGEAKGCLSLGMVDPAQAAQVPAEQSFERVSQIAQQRALEEQQRTQQQQQGPDQGPKR